MKTPWSWRFFLPVSAIILLFSSCQPATTEEPLPRCDCLLYINEQAESFCEKFAGPLPSKLNTLDTLNIIYEYDRCFGSSLNYLRHRPALAFYRTRDHSYEEEMRIFDLLYAYMRPDSLLELDINKPAGFALELWHRDSTYYSTQIKPQPNNSKIRIKESIFDRHGVFSPIVSIMTLYLGTTDPIYLWNQAGTDSVAVTFSYLKFEVGSDQL